MRSHAYPAALFAVSLIAATCGGDDKASLQGKWKLDHVKWAEADKTSSIYVSSKSYLIVDGDQMTRQDEDGNKVTETRYRYVLHERKKPAVYERTALDGKFKDKTTSGIYRIEGDTLKMCSKSKGLPADFDILQGSDVKDAYLYVYKRAAK
jgi:uncharacterized protein (TIGR03067 family)